MKYSFRIFPHKYTHTFWQTIHLTSTIKQPTNKKTDHLMVHLVGYESNQKFHINDTLWALSVHFIFTFIVKNNFILYIWLYYYLRKKSLKACQMLNFYFNRVKYGITDDIMKHLEIYVYETKYKRLCIINCLKACLLIFRL